MGWRSDLEVSREWALEEVLRSVLAMDCDELSSLVDYLNSTRTVNYRVREPRSDGEGEGSVMELLQASLIGIGIGLVIAALIGAT